MIGYLPWHYTTGFISLLGVFSNLFYFLFHFFSIPYLLRTLFSPWKRQVLGYETPGFNLRKIFETITFNLISRTIGAIIRLSTIFIWLLATILAILSFGVVLIIYVTIPLVSIPFYLGLKGEEKSQPANILAKYGAISRLLFPKIFNPEFARFLFSRLEIAWTDYPILTSTPNPSQDETLFTKNILKAAPNLPAYVAVFTEYFAPLRILLEQKNISKEDVVAIASWWETLRQEESFNQRFWELDNLQKIKCLGKDWAYGYTLNLDKFSQNLNYEALSSPKLIGRKREIETIERILSKRGENNVLLIGEPGVGKKTIVLGLAQRIAQGKTTPALSHKRVLLFDLNSAIAREFTVEGKRAKLLEILKEAQEAGNIILAISAFDRFVSGGEERINLTEVFAQTIGGSNLQVIGIITPDDYQRHIHPNTAVLSLFEPVEVFPPSRQEAIAILENLAPTFEKNNKQSFSLNKQSFSPNKVSISYFAIKEIVEKADTLVTDVPFPEKAINLLDEAVFYALNNLRITSLTKEVVDRLLSEKTKIPLTQITKAESEKLLDLESFLHQRIVDQEQAVRSLGDAMRRGRLRLGRQDKPIGSFLFLGPTGVGKTETAKALAQLYFGSEDKMIRFDMAEFIGIRAVEALIGSPSGQPGLLTTQVRQSPFAVLLLDEFEKTTPEVLNLFLTVFDEGYLKDSTGHQVSFANLIIIATSNAGAEFIREKVVSGISNEQLEKELIEYVLRERIFSPEFINRFDGVVVFKPLTSEHLQQIAKLMIDKLNARVSQEQDITVKITPELLAKIAELGYDPTFGARPMARVVQDKIESPVARMILEGKVKKGEEVEIKIAETENP